MESIRKHYKQRREFELSAFDPQTDMSDRKLAIRLLHNYPRSGGIEKYLQLLADNKAPEQLQHMKQPEALIAEIKQTIKRLMLPGEE